MSVTNLTSLARITNGRTGRASTWDTSGRNQDFWMIPAGKSRVLADIKGPGVITHIWMTQPAGYRECLLKFTWDDAPHASVLVPLGDFFCLGHGIVNSFQSLLFTASTARNYTFNSGCALNCYAPMPFRECAKIELINQGAKDQRQYFYIDYEQTDDLADELGYFHAEFRRTNPFGGWAHEIMVNSPEANIVNKERLAWDNNYVILETKGRGHYLGCNISVTNLQGTWWGEGDDMIWVDGYKWPPDIHGTGSEDYLNQAWGMQENAFLRNGSSIHESLTNPARGVPARGHNNGGYQTSYVFHIENPVRFQKEIKVTMEHGHGNHVRNEMSSVAYWYANRPAKAVQPPPVAQRMPIMRDIMGNWMLDKRNQTPIRNVPVNPEMRAMKKKWQARTSSQARKRGK
jgi:hypothetical protein